MTTGLDAGSKTQTATVLQRTPLGEGIRKRVLFLAVDAMDPALARRFADDMPNLRRMMAEGYSGRILPYVSCWVNMDFMSMMTGTPPGTQYRATPKSGSRFRHQDCASETIWHVLSSEGRRSFLLNFPGIVPDENTATVPGGSNGFTLQGGMVHQAGDVRIEGGYHEGLETTGWPPGGGPRPGRRYRVVDTPLLASGWRQFPDSNKPPLETKIGPLPVLLLAEGPGYDTVAVFEGKDGKEIARSAKGEWSSWGKITVKERQGTVRFRLLELKPDGSGLQLLQSAVCAMDGFSSPADLAGALVGRLGPMWHGSALQPSPLDPFWKVGEEEALEGAMWIARAAEESLELWDWDFFLHKASLADAALHQCLTLADPIYHGHDPETARKADAALRQAYADLDHVIGRMMQIVERRDDVTLIVASDHGGGVNNVVCDVNQCLRDAGLLAGTDREIDWSRTRAYTKRRRQGTEIYVNLKGREDQGIVDPDDYEKDQEAVIDALLNWRSPIDNKRAVTYALKLRDAALIGYWGPEAGDVQFCYNPGFVWGVNPDGRSIAPSQSPIANHGPQVVTGETGYSSMMGQLVAWGPGIAGGVRRDEQFAGPIPIASVAPTLSRLLACRIPQDCQLGLIEEMLA